MFYFRLEAKQSQIEASRSEKHCHIFSFEAKQENRKRAKQENRKRTRKLAKQNKAKKYYLFICFNLKRNIGSEFEVKSEKAKPVHPSLELGGGGMDSRRTVLIGNSRLLDQPAGMFISSVF